MSENQESQVPPTSIDPTAKAGCWVGWIGVLIGFSPIFIGLLGSLTCGPNANEGNCAAAAAPWLMFLSIPFGFIVGIVGIIIYAVAKRKRIRPTL